MPEYSEFQQSIKFRQKKNPMFTVTRPTLIFGPDPKVFINIFLFLIKSYIVLKVVCQTRLGSLGVFYELETLLHSIKYKFINFTVPF